MKSLKKYKNAFIFFWCIIIIFLLISPVTNIYCTLKFKKSEVININSEFKVVNNDLYEITPEGEYYLHTFKGKPEKTNLPDMTYTYDYLFTNVKNYISQEDIQKAINSDYFSASFDLAYIKDNNLFVQGGNRDGVLGVGHNQPLDCYEQINYIKNAKKVSVAKQYCRSTVVLTTNNLLYICSENNEYSKKEPYKFFKVEHPYKFIDMDSNLINTIALDENGDVYNIIFNIKKIDLDKKIKQICATGWTCLALSEDSKTIYEWGDYFVGKGIESYKREIKGYYHADKILAGQNYVYIFDGDTIIRASLK